MLPTTLDHPDPAIERLDPARSKSIADELVACYTLVQRGEYSAASERLSTFEHLEKSPKQALRVLYLRATTSLRLRKLPTGLAPLAEGMELAEQSNDFGALAQFAYLYATTQRELGEPRVAACHAEVALEAWRLYVAPEPADEQDVLFELDTLILLNQLYFFSGKSVRAERAFRAARRIVAHSRIPPLRRGNLAWIEALFYRWRAEPGRALDCGLSALAVIDDFGTSLERARLRTLLADIAMDLAEHSGVSTYGEARRPFLDMANTFARVALTGLAAAGDPFALGLGQLTNARLARMTNRNVDRLRMLDDVAIVVGAYGDRTVLGQVWSARGDEYLARGHRGSAEHCYLEAIETLGKANMRAHSVWALRSLRKARMS